MIAIALVACVPAAHAATGFSTREHFEVKPWSGHASFKADTGTFVRCTLTRKTPSGAYLQFRYTGTGLAIATSAIRKRKSTGERFTVGLSIDKSLQVSAQAVAVAPTAGAPAFVLIELKPSDRMLAILKRGNVLSIDDGRTKHRFRLEATARALTKLESCLFRHDTAARDSGLLAKNIGEKEELFPESNHRDAEPNFAVPQTVAQKDNLFAPSLSDPLTSWIEFVHK